MTKEQLIEKLKGREETGWEIIKLLQSEAAKSEFGEIEVADETGSSEGGGEYSHYVFWFKDHNLYARITGCYTSHHGTDWNDDWTIVEPKQEMITVYR